MTIKHAFPFLLLSPRNVSYTFCLTTDIKLYALVHVVYYPSYN